MVAPNGQVLLLALDWKKAFDCIAPARLMNALERFGVNASMRQAIAGIYQERYFCVREGSEVSEPRAQNAGIS